MFDVAADVASGGRVIGRVASQYWVNSPWDVRRRALGQLAGVLVLQYLRAKAANVLAGHSAKLLDALSRDQNGDWRRLALVKVFMVLSFSPLDAWYEWALRRMTTAWSKFMTDRLLSGYVALGVLGLAGRDSSRRAGPGNVSGNDGNDGGFDSSNLEQQLSEDVDKFVDILSSVGLETIQAALHLHLFSQTLSRLAPGLSRATIALAIGGTALTVGVGKTLPRLYRAERDAANDFRFSLTRVRENAESIAFYNGERHEIRGLRDMYSNKLATMWARKARRDMVSVVSSTYRKITGLLPFFMIARTLDMMKPDGHSHATHGHTHATHGHSHASHGHSHGQVVHGHSHSSSSGGGGQGAVQGVGLFVQASEAFNEILFHLMIIAENLNDFSRLKAVAEQLDELTGRMAELSGDNIKCSDATEISLQESPLFQAGEEADGSEPWLSLKDLTVSCRGAPLIKNLTFDVFPGSRLLITGESGVGKTTLLRAIQGLYSRGHGSIIRPPRDELFFIPQNPYMVLGSLREQLLYPLPKERIDKSRDSELLDALHLVGLDAVLLRLTSDSCSEEEALDKVLRWSQVLSFGEQQRLAFARLVLLKPNRAFVFLDESTSALDAANEHRMYALLAASCSSWVSIGHRPSIERFHDQKLELQREGLWTLEPILN